MLCGCFKPLPETEAVMSARSSDIPVREISQGILKIPFENILKYDYEIYSFLLFISMVQQNRVNIKVADALGPCLAR